MEEDKTGRLSELFCGNELRQQRVKYDVHICVLRLCCAQPLARFHRGQQCRVISGTHKFDRGLSRLHTELHWLNVPERVAFKLGLMVFNCLHNQTPQYLVDLCQSVSSVASRQHLRSASRGLLVVPRHRLSSYGRRAFSVAGPTIWNWLSLIRVERSGQQQRLLQAFTEDVIIFSFLVYIAH